MSRPGPESITFGALADCQYADVPTEGVREYRLSVAKLRDCVEHLNELELAFVLHLGDSIDRDAAGFDVVRPLFDALVAERFQVLGNHDYSVADHLKQSVPRHLGMMNRYHHFLRGGWRFVVLDGNEISLHAHPLGSLDHSLAREHHERFYADSPRWNGALSGAQLLWLDGVLSAADAVLEPVVVCCHYPIFEEGRHNLWNAKALRDRLTRHRQVKAYLSGHDHAGHHAVYDGLQLLSLSGMVDTEETAYCVITLERERLRVQGFGREPDRELTLR